jgi:hypothetical protein
MFVCVCLCVCVLDFCMVIFRTNVTLLDKDTELTFQYIKAVK